jgi:hypothetical protein
MALRDNRMTFKEWLFAGVCFAIFYLAVNEINDNPVTLELKEIKVYGHSRTN